MGGYYEVYKSLLDREGFSYANVRKAAYQGITRLMINVLIILTIYIPSVFKFCVIGGIFLQMFADSLLFDMMLKTAFQDGVDTPEDLIDRDMSLGIRKSCV